MGKSRGHDSSLPLSESWIKANGLNVSRYGVNVAPWPPYFSGQTQCYQGTQHAYYGTNAYRSRNNPSKGSIFHGKRIDAGRYCYLIIP